MMKPQSLSWIVADAILWLAPTDSFAQYKNSSFGLDLGGWLITKPTLLDADGNILALDNRPLRINHGGRAGFESSFKMDDDHFWFTVRGNVGFMEFSSAAGDSPEAIFDAEANKALGTLVGFQGSIGIRYYVFTDRIRPYLQASLSYLRLMTFTGSAESACTNSTVCDTSQTNLANLLPHPNVGAIHFQPGMEWIFTRDIALNIFADLQRWLIFNADDNNSLVLGIGINFYT